MKKYVLACMVLLTVLCFVCGATGANAPKVDVLYMNHPPMQPTIKQLKETLSRYGSKVNVSWHDLDTADGKQFMAAKGLQEHVPLIIWIDGSYSVTLPQGPVKFTGFPVGSGPPPFQGKWTLKDLETALNQAITRK